jgi:hypothetical protein
MHTHTHILSLFLPPSLTHTLSLLSLHTHRSSSERHGTSVVPTSLVATAHIHCHHYRLSQYQYRRYYYCCCRCPFSTVTAPFSPSISNCLWRSRRWWWRWWRRRWRNCGSRYEYVYCSIPQYIAQRICMFLLTHAYICMFLLHFTVQDFIFLCRSIFLETREIACRSLLHDNIR